MKIGNAVRNANSDSSINGNWTPKYCPEKKNKKMHEPHEFNCEHNDDK